MREPSAISAGNTPKSWQEEFDGIFLPGQLEAQFPAAPVNYTAQPKKILNFALLNFLLRRLKWLDAHGIMLLFYERFSPFRSGRKAANWRHYGHLFSNEYTQPDAPDFCGNVGAAAAFADAAVFRYGGWEETTGITEEPAEEAAETETTDIPETAEIQRFFPDYTLDDYADVMYGTGTIKNNGCSVCCMAVVATYLTGHQYYPDELAKWFGGKAENNTDRIRYMAQALQLPMTEAENYDYVKQALREGKIVIQLMNSRSLFTNSQHFILLKGFNENGKIEVYDPSTYNRQSWRLNDRFENGFGTDEICWGYDGAFIFDPSQMSDDPFVYEEPVRPYVEPRYDGLKLTDDETKLLAKLIYVEARGESEEGQQAIAEVVLNRLVSGDFGSSITNMINDESQFVPHKLILTADPSQAQYEAIDRALYGPYVLPKEVTFYGRVRTTDSVWGTIGGHIFCYPWHYKDTHQEITQAS